MDELINDNCDNNCQIIVSDLSRKLYYTTDEFIKHLENFKEYNKIREIDFDLKKYLTEITDGFSNKSRVESIYNKYKSFDSNDELKNLTNNYVNIISLSRKIKTVINGVSKEGNKDTVTLKTLKHMYRKNVSLIQKLEDQLNTSNRNIYLKKIEVRDSGRKSLILKYLLICLIALVILIGVLSKF